MPKLSVNINKVAVLRNSRGGNYPDVLDAAHIAIRAGVQSITVHPRSDARHITLDDVIALRNLPAIQSGQVELNVEADLRQQIVDLISVIKPTQYTIVPGVPAELTSTRGWRPYDDQERLRRVVTKLRPVCRLSIFCDPSVAAVQFLQQSGVHAVEINTRLYTELWARGEHRAHVEEIRKAADAAHKAGLRVHGGHDLSVENMPDLLSVVDFDELSIGHHLISKALMVGLESVTEEYLKTIATFTK